MGNKLGRHLYKHGQFAGWNEFRYGGSTKEVSLAGKKAKPVLSAAKREAMVGRVAHLFEEAAVFPFENEGAIRHGLRQAFCLGGASWRAADNEAEYLTEAAVRALGLERPTWAEGQPDFAGDCDYCSRCHGPIDEESRSRRQRFCSVECAKIAVLERSKVVEKHDGGVRRSALRLITKDRMPPRPCQHCGTMFKTDRETALYCSAKCTAHGNYGERLIPDIVCQGCGKVTKPANRGARFCSLSCRSTTVLVERRAKLGTIVKACAECGENFTPASERAQFCSARCGSRERNRQFRARKGQAASFAYTCRCCGVGFTARRPQAPYCGKPCKDLVERVENGQAKRITTRVFDYVFDPPAATTRALVDALFEGA